MADRTIIGKNLDVSPFNFKTLSPSFPHAEPVPGFGEFPSADGTDGPTFVEVSANGSQLMLSGDAWKTTQTSTFVYTSGLYISFDYMQTGESKIQGIDFDPTPYGSYLPFPFNVYQIGGTEAFGTRTDFPYQRDYKSTDLGNWKSYLFEIKGLSESTNYKLVFINDNDSSVSSISTSPNTYFRNIKIGVPSSGMFISKPGRSAASDHPGHLLLSTEGGFFQPLKSGRALIPAAAGSGIGQEGELTVTTGVASPHADQSPVIVSWNIVVTSANVHPSFGGSLYSGFYQGGVEVVSNFSGIGTQFIDDVNNWDENVESQNRVIPQIGLVCFSNVNATYTPPTIELYFKNGSTKNSQLVFWTIYRERGLPET